MSKNIIIAEAGVNHNGKLSLALKMVDIAAKSGADFVKFQKFDPKLLAQKNLGLANYQKKFTQIKSQLKMLNKLTLKDKDYQKIIKRCKQKKIKFLLSPFDLESVNYIKKLRIKVIKIPSGEINNVPYLREIGKMKVSIILSTGMSDLNEIKNAINILINSGTKKRNISVLHCNTEYPANTKKLNLNSIPFLKNKLRLNIGYSDHSLGYGASLMALALGAKIFEKHFTLNKNLKGPDHEASLSPKELIKYVANLRKFEKSLGKYEKKPYREEIINSKVVRKQIIASKKIKKGEKFNKENITTKRAKVGISAAKWDKVIGKVSNFNFLPDENIRLK